MGWDIEQPLKKCGEISQARPERPSRGQSYSPFILSEGLVWGGPPRKHVRHAPRTSRGRAGPLSVWRSCVGWGFRTARLLTSWKCGFQQGHILGFPNNGQGQSIQGHSHSTRVKSRSPCQNLDTLAFGS